MTNFNLIETLINKMFTETPMESKEIDICSIEVEEIIKLCGWDIEEFYEKLSDINMSDVNASYYA